MSSKVRSLVNGKGVVENVVVPADKASNNIVFVCKTYYIDCLVRELGISNNTGNSTYTPTSLSKEKILSNYKSVISSFVLYIKDDHVNLPSLYWIPKLVSVQIKIHCRICQVLHQLTVEDPDHCTLHSKMMDSRLAVIPPIHLMASSRCGFRTLVESFSSPTIPYVKLKSRLRDLVRLATVPSFYYAPIIFLSYLP